MDQAPSPWVTLPVKVEKDDSSPTDNTNISEPVNFWQEVKKKKKRNRGSKGRSNSVATQTVARETKSKDTHGGFAAIMETLLQVEDPEKPLLDAEGVYSELTLSLLVKNFSRRHFVIFIVFHFSQKLGFDISPKDNLHKMSKPVFWEKIRKNIINWSSAEYVQRVLKVN